MATYPIKLQNGNDDILLPITYAGLVQINDNGTTKSLSEAWDDHKRFIVNFQLSGENNDVVTPDKTFQEIYDAFNRGAEIYGNFYVNGGDSPISMFIVNGYYNGFFEGFVFDMISFPSSPFSIIEIVYRSNGSVVQNTRGISDAVSYSSTIGINIGGTSGVKLIGSDKINIVADSNVLTFNHAAPFSSSSGAGPTTNGSSSGQLAHGGSFSVPRINFDKYGHITSATTLPFTLPASEHSNYGSKTAGTDSSSISPSHGGTFTVPYITTDNYGHVNSLGNTTITLPADSNTDTKVTVTSTSNDVNYPLIFKYGSSNSNQTTGLRFDSDGLTNSYYNPGKNTLFVTYSYAIEFTENGIPLPSKYSPISHVNTYASTSAYGHVKVDDTLNNTSTNPVQNKVIYTKMIENEQTTAIGLAVLNSRLDTVEANSSQISNYISKSGSNKVDNDQEIHWSKYSGNIDGLHLTNSSIGWSSGQVNTGGIMTTYSVATFSRSGISIGSSLTDSGLHFNVSGSGLYTYVRVGGNNKISLETNGTAGQIVAPKFMENSDERLKTDIEKIANIGEINMYEFNMNGSHMYGFVAQDLEKTHPELVTTSSEDSGEINNVKSVDYNSSLSLVVSKLINKITELEERIKELEKK